MLFASPSSAKRKRESLEHSSKIVEAYLHGKISDFTYSERCNGRLLPTGDLMIVDHSKISLRKNILEGTENSIASFDIGFITFLNLYREFDFSKSYREFVGCSSTGYYIFGYYGEDDRLYVLDHKMHLDDANDEVTAVCYGGHFGIVGTSFGKLYIIGRDGNGNSFTYQLCEAQNLLYGIVQSGAKLFRFSATSDVAYTRIAKTICISTSTNLAEGYLLAISNKSLQLWKNWSYGSGSEVLQWNIPLQNIPGMNQFYGDDSQLHIHDMIATKLRPSDMHTTCVVILLFSVVTSTGTVSYLHILDLSLLPTHTSRGNVYGVDWDSSTPCTILLSRKFVTSQGNQWSPSVKGIFLPRLYENLPVGDEGWSLGVTWGNGRAGAGVAGVATSAYSPAEECNTMSQELHAIEITDLKRTLLRALATNSKGLQTELGDLLLDGVTESRSQTSTGVLCEDIISMCPLHNATWKKQVCIVLKDGAISLCNPFRVTITKTGAVLVAPTKTAASNALTTDEVFKTLTKYCNQEISLEDLYSALIAIVNNKEKDNADAGSIMNLINGAVKCSHDITSTLVLRSDENARRTEKTLSRSYLLNDKLYRHNKLMHGLQMIIGDNDLSKGHSHSLLSSGIPSEVVRNHQLLTACSKMDKFLQDKSNSNVVRTYEAKSTGSKSSRESDQVLFDIIYQGIRQEIENRGVNSENILNEGFHVMDAFFSQPLLLPSGLLCISEVLLGLIHQLQFDPSNTNFSNISYSSLLLVSYNMCTLYLSVISAAVLNTDPDKANKSVGGVEDDVHSVLLQDGNHLECMSIATTDDIRRGVLCVFEGIRIISSNINSRNANQSAIQNIIRNDWEGQRLYELSFIVLKGFEVANIIKCHDKQEFDFIGMSSSKKDWKRSSASASKHDEEFLQAKITTVEMLLALGSNYAEFAFRISSRFDHHIGIMKAVMEFDPRKPLLPLLHTELIEKSKSTLSNTNLSFPIFCFEWLENKKMFVDILDVGKYAPNDLNVFLKTRPWLSWLHSLENKEYKSASAASFQHANSVSNSISTSKTLYSISRLSRLVSDDDSDDLDVTNIHSMHELHIIRGQEIIISQLPNSLDTSTSPKRMSAEDVIQGLFAIVESRSDTESNEALPDLSTHGVLHLILKLLANEVHHINSTASSQNWTLDTYPWTKKVRRIFRLAVATESSLWVSLACDDQDFNIQQDDTAMRESILFKLLLHCLIASRSNDASERNIAKLFCIEIVQADAHIGTRVKSMTQEKEACSVEVKKHFNLSNLNRIHIAIRKCIGLLQSDVHL